MDIRLDFNDGIINFQIIGESNVISKHTSKELQHLSLEVIAYGDEENKAILRLIDIGKKQGCSSLDDEDNVLKLWKVTNNSWMSSGNSPLYTHNVDIKEVELLEVSSLKIGEVVLEPYFYEEYFYNDRLTVNAKSIISNDQQSLIKNMVNQVISVIRHGIDERPRQMTLSSGLWSETDETIKHEIVLTDTINESYLKKDKMSDSYYIDVRTSFETAKNQALLDLLLNVLINKNILSEEEINKIYDEATEQINSRVYNFYLVDDIDG